MLIPGDGPRGRKPVITAPILSQSLRSGRTVRCRPAGGRHEDCRPGWNPPTSLHPEASTQDVPVFQQQVAAGNLWPSAAPRRRTGRVRPRLQLPTIAESPISTSAAAAFSRNTPSFNSMIRSGITRGSRKWPSAVAAASLIKASSLTMHPGVGVPS